MIRGGFLQYLQWKPCNIYRLQENPCRCWRFSLQILQKPPSNNPVILCKHLQCSSKSKWPSTWTDNSNGNWTDKQSSHFRTAKEMSVKTTVFSCKNHDKFLCCWNHSFANDEWLEPLFLSLMEIISAIKDPNKWVNVLYISIKECLIHFRNR